MNIFRSFSLIIHPQKSVLTPKKERNIYIYVILSKLRGHDCFTHREEKVPKACAGLKLEAKCAIRELAQVIGQLVAGWCTVGTSILQSLG